MDLTFVTFLVLFASAMAGKAEDECGEKKAGPCMTNLLDTLMGDADEEEMCRATKEATQCLRSAAEECLGEDRDPEVDKSLAELDSLIEQNCAEAGEEDNEWDRCLANHGEYIYSCIAEGTAEALEALDGVDKENLNENVLKCGMYGMLANCIVERTGEMCGREAKAIAEAEMMDLPDDIEEACSSWEVVELYSLELLDKRKKK